VERNDYPKQKYEGFIEKDKYKSYMLVRVVKPGLFTKKMEKNIFSNNFQRKIRRLRLFMKIENDINMIII